MTPGRFLTRALIGTLIVVGFLAVARSMLRSRGQADLAAGQPHTAFRLTSASFEAGANIPKRLSCEGGNESPALEFAMAPAGTKSFALVMEDLSAPFGFVHWLLYNIPPQVGALEEGAASSGKLPLTAAQGQNSVQRVSYIGPCPPGDKPHRYVVRLYALNSTPNLPAGLNKRQLAAALNGRILAEGELTGSFAKGGP